MSNDGQKDKGELGQDTASLEEATNQMMFYLDDMGIFEHCAANRSGKTFLVAKGGWDAYNNGQKVYCNCPTDPVTNEIEHILNYPHIDYDPYELRYTNLTNVYVMIDEAAQVLDARVCAKKEIRQLSHFFYQAKKRSLSLHYDTVLHGNIDPRIRKNPDFIIYSHRVPKNWREPLQQIRLTIAHANGEAHAKIADPWQFLKPYPIYNDTVMVRQH